ncbi:hypothetical protein [Ruegeria atlantica]|uniref:hypothetical protein n=1 Tax=Ruegeria atlantica TaxID=81569 RepID=UPI00147C8086|nr:hypothetical protein [Ruegeria atlantica]
MIEIDERSRSERERAAWIEAGREPIAQRREAQALETGSAWSMGDWANSWDRAYGDLSLALAELAYDGGYDYVKICAHVARRFPADRRNAGLSFGHHQAVAALEPTEADRLLVQAGLQGWSRDRTRDEARIARSEASLRRENERLRAVNAELEARVAAGEASNVVADIERANKADLAEALRLVERCVSRVESPACIGALQALHGNAAAAAEKRVSKLIFDFIEKQRPAMIRIHAWLEHRGKGARIQDTNGYAAHNHHDSAQAPPKLQNTGFSP